MERDAPWRGRIFYTKNFLTFYGKYFNKAAKVIIPWREILNVEKKMTAGVFPNAIRITALHTKVRRTSGASFSPSSPVVQFLLICQARYRVLQN